MHSALPHSDNVQVMRLHSLLTINLQEALDMTRAPVMKSTAVSMGPVL